MRGFLIAVVVCVGLAFPAAAQDTFLPYGQLVCKTIGAPPAAHAECWIARKIDGDTISTVINRSDTAHNLGSCIGDMWQQNRKVVSVGPNGAIVRPGC